MRRLFFPSLQFFIQFRIRLDSDFQFFLVKTEAAIPLCSLGSLRIRILTNYLCPLFLAPLSC